MTAINYRRYTTGKVAAICHICGQMSAPALPDHDGEPDMFALGKGWSQAPYPPDFVDPVDGSIGSKHTCPKCNSLFSAGHRLQTRAYLKYPNATPLTARHAAIVLNKEAA